MPNDLNGLTSSVLSTGAQETGTASEARPINMVTGLSQIPNGYDIGTSEQVYVIVRRHP